jgi:hypothetical protein
MADNDARSEDRLDLAALDPLADPRRFERVMGRVLDAAADELARRRAELGLGGLIVAWRRLILAAFGLVAAASILALFLANEPPTRAGETATVEEALGVPRTWSGWVRGDARPTPGELLDVGGAGGDEP